MIPDLRQTPTPPTLPVPSTAAAAAAATPATPPDGGAEPHLAGKSLLRPPALRPRAGAARGGRERVVKRLLASQARPKPYAD